MTITEQQERTRTAPTDHDGGLTAIRMDAVRKTFGKVHAVTDIDLTIRPGEVVAFLGPNGAGKTTSIDMMLGLSAPTSGTVEVLGMDPRAAIARGLVAAVMQSGGLLKDLTVKETVEYTASLFADTQPVGDVMAAAGIEAIASRKVGKCSGGEQQRLRFAMALLSDPLLLLLDEPTTGMDVEGRQSFWEAIRGDARQGRTVLFATHYLEEADRYADRIILLSQGRIVADGTGSQIRALASGRTVRARLAAPDVEAITALGGVEQVDVRGDQVSIHAADSDAVVRYLINHTAACDLEVTARGLEDAFLALTGRQATEGEDR